MADRNRNNDGGGSDNDSSEYHELNPSVKRKIMNPVTVDLDDSTVKKSKNNGSDASAAAGSDDNRSTRTNRSRKLTNRTSDIYEKFLNDRHYQLHAIFLLIILLLGIILLIIGVNVLISSLRTRESVCETHQCLLSSSRHLSYIDDSPSSQNDPCNDFYQFACGRWIANHRQQDQNYQNQQQIESVQQENINNIWLEVKHYLDKVLSTLPSTDPFFKAKRFYESCMNLEEIDLSSLNYIIHEISSAGGWNILGNWHGPSWNQEMALEKLQTYFGVNAFFKITIGADDLDPSLPFIIKILPSGLGLPKSFYFDPEYKTIQEAYKQYMSEAVRIFGATRLDSSQFAENTYNYEKRIAEITPDQIDYGQPLNMFKRRYSIRELKILAPSIKWLKLLQKFFEKARLNDNTRVILAFEPYFRNISNIISTTDSKGLNDYLIWKMISKYAPFLSKDFRMAHWNFQRIRAGLPAVNSINDDDRWRFCLETTSKHLGQALSALYISNKVLEFVNSTSRVRSEIVDRVRETILRTPESFVWYKPNSAGGIDEEAQKFIQMKLKQMDVYVGQPQFLLKPTLVEYYNEYFPQIKFLQNILEAINHRHKKMEMLLNEKNFDFAWPLLAYDVEIGYDYASNKLFIPAGMFQWPFYDIENQPFASQYGAIGFHVAANMLKSFDLVGLCYGLPDGRLSNTNRRFINDHDFNKGLICLNDKLNFISNRLNNTISQTYIDEGALNIAWLTYKNQNPLNEQPVLPSLKLSNDQLFFLSFAQSMCHREIRPEAVNMLYETSDRLPNSIRVNFLLSQNKIFENVFKCSKSKQTSSIDSLVLKQDCHLWN